MTAAWLGLGGSTALIVWQMTAYLTGHVPDHIMPLVHLLSGEHEDIPMAYDWTLRIGLASVAIFGGSIATLAAIRIFLPRRL